MKNFVSYINGSNLTSKTVVKLMLKFYEMWDMLVASLEKL